MIKHLGKVLTSPVYQFDSASRHSIPCACGDQHACPSMLMCFVVMCAPLELEKSTVRWLSWPCHTVNSLQLVIIVSSHVVLVLGSFLEWICQTVGGGGRHELFSRTANASNSGSCEISSISLGI